MSVDRPAPGFPRHGGSKALSRKRTPVTLCFGSASDVVHAEPVDDKTVSMICHEISHWFGAEDIIDAEFPERSVMNYKDERFGSVGGRIVWDEANRKRILRGIGDWRKRYGTEQ